MKRITQSFFLILFLASPALCQEPDTIVAASQPDTIVASSLPDSVVAASQPDTIIEPGYLSGDSVSTPRTHREGRRRADTLIVKEPDFSHSSRKALMYALVLPGLGQGYNKKYYKIPIVCAALGGVGYAIVYNTKNYREATANYIVQPDEANQWYLDAWRRNMEISYIGLILVYALQALDAYVDAELYNWDVNDDLSLRIAPSLQPMMAPAPRTGQVLSLTCRIDLKRR